jgi:hypothetical protein
MIIIHSADFFSHVWRFFRWNGRVNVLKVVSDPGFEMADAISKPTSQSQDVTD